MTTLAIMKADIADDLARADLTTVIAKGITQAIDYYQSKRFHFNEVSGDTFYFNSVANQEWYDKYDHVDIPKLREIDTIVVDVTSTARYTLRREDPRFFETRLNTTSTNGEPNCYTYFNKKLRVYPVPAVSTYTFRVTGLVDVDAPASDSEVNNPWMTDAKDLIRARATVNVMRKVNASKLGESYSKEDLMMYEGITKEALDELQGRANIMRGTGVIMPYGM